MNAKQDRISIRVEGTNDNPYATNAYWVLFAVYKNEHEAHEAVERVRIQYSFARIVVETTFK